MKNFILLWCLIFIGCGPQLTLENQVRNKKLVSRVFINNPRCITIVYKTDSGSYISENLICTNVIEYIESDDGMYVSWNSYSGNFAKYDMVVHLPDISLLEAGENNKGKFGTDKLIEVN